LGDITTAGMMIIKSILKRQIWGWGMDSTGSREGPVAGSYEHGNLISGSIRCWATISFLSSYLLYGFGWLVGWLV